MRIGIAGTLSGALLALPMISSSAAAGVQDHHHRHPTVTAVADVREALVGATVTFSGRVRPVVSGGRVVLQERPAGAATWTPVASGSLRRRGTYAIPLTIDRVGAASYRVTTFSRHHRPALVSPESVLTSYQWRPLTSLTPTDLGYMRVGTATLGGVDHPGSLVATPPTSRTISTATYDLAGGCTRLRGTGGAEGDYTAGSADGVGWSVVTSRPDHPASPWHGLGGYLEGQFGSVTADIRDSVSTTILIQASDAVGVLGSPEVLCSF